MSRFREELWDVLRQSVLPDVFSEAAHNTLQTNVRSVLIPEMIAHGLDQQEQTIHIFVEIILKQLPEITKLLVS